MTLHLGSAQCAVKRPLAAIRKELEMAIPEYDDVYGSKYLSAENLDKDCTSEISDVTVETFDRAGEPAKTKAVLWLDNQARPLVVTKTNAGNLADAFGKPFKGWIGQTVEIRRERVNYAGKT